MTSAAPAQYPLAFCEANRVIRLPDQEGRPVAAYAGELHPETARRLAFYHRARPLYVRLDPADFAVRLGRLHSFSAEEAPAPDGEEGDQALGEVDDGAPVVNYLDALILDAARKGASDIHLEWARPLARVRLRIDGALREAEGFPSSRFPAVSSRLKLLAGLDIVEKRLPQDGRIPLDGPSGRLDLRASFIPASRGESIVLRILPGERSLLAPADLGLPAPLLSALLEMTDRLQGLVLATGPTGSGKTTTLCALASRLAERGLKVITIEDPVEYSLPGAVQVQVNEGAGLGFAGLLARVLRQDPDVIMVGEIRDAETAALALRAALTGHLVLSSLHTGDAAGAVERLRDLGMPPYLCAATLRGVLAQRLVRHSCPACAGRASIDKPLASDASGTAPAPCPSCACTGFQGRLALFELLDCRGPCAELVAAGAGAPALRSWMAQAGMGSLALSGRRAVAAGLTSLEEVGREVDL